MSQKMKKTKILERDVQRAVVDLLKYDRWKIYRTNTMGIWDEKRGKYRRLQGEKGFPDLVTLKYNQPILFLEVKRPGEKLSPAQREFRDLFYKTKQSALWLIIDDVDKMDKALKMLGGN